MPEYAGINGIKFYNNEGCNYKNDYIKTLYDISSDTEFNRTKTLRRLIREDLFFIVYFVLGIKIANAPFVVEMCQEVENGPPTQTIDIWPRYHFKSTIITISETIQRVLTYPERCNAIFSFRKDAAERFLSSIRSALETDFLRQLFPDVLFEDPFKESPSWGLQKGITVKRKNTTRGEKTVASYGLIDGMPQGSHFDHLGFDDVETDDMSESKELLDKALHKYLMAQNLRSGSKTDSTRTVGTFYSHFGMLVRLIEKQYGDGSPIYHYRRRCVTVDGTLDGEGVLLDKREIEKIYIELGEKIFYSQMMCDPTPRFAVELEPNLLKEIEPSELPDDIFKFMIVDPAGSRKIENQSRDYWGAHIIGVSKETDNIGAVNIYIIDSYIGQTNEAEIVFILNNMYWKNAFIEAFAYEKNGGITPGWLLHLASTLQARGMIISEDSKNIIPLSHQNREKKQRIIDALRLPLLNGKIHYLNTINEKYISHLKEEMVRFPVWHDDGIDALSYIYQVLDKYGFRWRLSNKNNTSDLMNMSLSSNKEYGWLGT